MMATSEPPVKFDLKSVHDGFSSSLLENDDVDMNFYLTAYKELYKFCNLLGTIFGFVGSDIKAKIDILESLVSEDAQSGNFSTFKAMVEYEKQSDLIKKSDYVSGCRTLLRLHRGLDFIRLFLKRVGELEAKDKTSIVGQEAYNETLAQFHPWLIRKGVVVSLYSLPTKENLMLKVRLYCH
ncbi:ceramide-1-phosphate transfer protein-like isoform X2 [Hetaerina americana]|uniref:ceramide-1-phosphate transfer protein-like isoform X2 n=1 Tax=Hetaerina americana TaxID=62018 RepID=UPI003A7F1DE5